MFSVPVVPRGSRPMSSRFPARTVGVREVSLPVPELFFQRSIPFRADPTSLTHGFHHTLGALPGQTLFSGGYKNIVQASILFFPFPPNHCVFLRPVDIYLRPSSYSSPSSPAVLFRRSPRRRQLRLCLGRSCPISQLRLDRRCPSGHGDKSLNPPAPSTIARRHRISNSNSKGQQDT